MAVSSETIEIRLSGLNRLNQLETTLTRLSSLTDSVADGIASINSELEQNRGSVRRLAQIERLSRSTIENNTRYTDPATRRATGTPLSASERRRRQRQSDEARADRSQSIAEMRTIGNRTRQLRGERRRQQIAQAQYREEYSNAIQERDNLISQLDDVRERSFRELRSTRFRTRVRATRSLISARQDDARRLGRSPFIRGQDLTSRDQAITRDASINNQQIARLQENETAARRLIGTRIGSLMRQRGAARRGGNAELVRSLNERITGLEGDLQAELRESQATRYALTVDLGRLNQRRRSLSAIGRGRSSVSRTGQSIRQRARALQEIYGVTDSQLTVDIGETNPETGRRVRTQINRATQIAAVEANTRNNISGAKDINTLAAKRVTFLERELGINNKIQSAEQKRLLAIQRLTDKLADFQTAGASGERFQAFEQLVRRLQGMANSRNMPAFDRLVTEANAAASRVAVPRGLRRGPSSPIRGETFIPGSEKNIAARGISALTIEELQQKLEAARRPGQPSFAFQRAESLVSRLQPLADANNFRELDNVVKQARRAIGIVTRENKSIADATKARTKDEKEIENLTKKVLSGKRLEAAEVDRLQTLRPSPTASTIPALPAAAPGSPAMSGGARALRTQSVISGAAQPVIQEILGGGRTVDDAQISRRLAESFAVKAGKKAGPKFAQAFVSQAADSFNAQQLLSGFGAAFGVFSDKSIKGIVGGAGVREKQRQSALTSLTNAEINIRRAGKKVEADILAGKKITLEQVDKLNRFYELQGRPAASSLPALPPASPKSPLFGPGKPAMPGSPAYGIGVSTGVRPGLRGGQSVINGVPQPRITEILGGRRTSEEAKRAFEGAASEGRRAAARANEIAKTERKLGEERTKQAAKIVSGVADAGRKIRSLFEGGIIDSRQYDTFKRQLISIGRAVGSGNASLGQLSGRLLFRQRNIADTERAAKRTKAVEAQTNKQTRAEQGYALALDKAVRSYEGLDMAAQKAIDTAAGLYSDTDLKGFLESINSTEEAYKKLVKLQKNELSVFDQKLAKAEESNKRARDANSARGSALTVEQKLIGLQNKGVDIGDQLFRLEAARVGLGDDLSRVSLQKLQALQGELTSSKQLLSIETARLRASAGIATASKSSRRIIEGVAAAGTRLTNLFESGAIKDPANYAKRREKLIAIGRSARAGDVSPDRLGERLRKQQRKINEFQQNIPEDPTAFIARASRVGDRLSGLTRGRSDTKGKAKALRSELIEIITAARDGIRPIRELSGELADLSAQVSRIPRKVAPSTGKTNKISGLALAIDTPRQVKNLETDAKALQARFSKLQQSGVNVGSAILDLERSIASTRDDSSQYTVDGVNGLKAQVAEARKLLSLENARLALTGKKVARRGGGLTELLGQIANSKKEAEMFLGGRSPEKAISNIVSTFNKSVGGAPWSPQMKSGASNEAQNVVDTFTSKLAAGTSKAASAGMRFAGAGVDGIKKAFGIKSPSRVMIEIALNLVNTYISELEKAIPQIQAISEKAFAEPKQASGPSTGIKVRQLNARNEDAAVFSLRMFGVLSPSQMDSPTAATDIVRARGASPDIGSLPEYDKAYAARVSGVPFLTPEVEKIQAVLRDFYGLAGSTGNAVENAADSMRLSEQEAKQLVQTVNELTAGLSSISDFIKGAASMMKTPAMPGAQGQFQDSIAKAAAIDAENATKEKERRQIAAGFAPSIAEASRLDELAKAKAIAEQFAASRAQAEADARAAANVITPSVADVTDAAVADGEADIRNAVQRFFDRITRALSTFGGGSLFGGGGGGRPPIPPTGPDPGDFENRVNAARGNAKELLRIADLADLSKASVNELKYLSEAFSNLRDTLRITDREFKGLTKVLSKIDDQVSRRDPNADLLTRSFGQRGGQAIGEGLIGGAFPLLFGQGIGASVLGGLGGGLGGFAGGTLGFGLSLAGTALGSAFDGLVQSAQDTGNMLRDVIGNFDQIKESGLLASRQQEKLIEKLIEGGNKTAAYSIIQDELNRKLGVDGAAKLREAADAGDRLKRAMADVGFQMQLFIAGPLTDFLNKIAAGLGKANKAGVADSEFRKIKDEKRQREFLLALSSENIKAGADPKLNGVSFVKTSRGTVPIGSTSLQATGRQLLDDLTSNLSAEQIRRVAERFTPKAPAKPLPEEQKRQQVINAAEDKLKKAQEDLDIFTKQNEGRDIIKGFKQQATAIKREQEDIDKQSFELRRDYERQIGDIRRGIEDKIAQIRQESAQKELEILATQGQLAEQQFKNAAAVLQQELAGNEIGQTLVDAVTTYLGAQLSAQNEIEQRRKQFEIEIQNQQIELEKYKIDVARTISQLNISTVEKVQEINRGIARRNEDAALNNFNYEKESAKLKTQVLQNELDLMRAKQADFEALARFRSQDNPGDETLKKIAKVEKERLDNYDKTIAEVDRSFTAIEKLQPPPRIREIPAVSTQSPSLAGVDRAAANAKRLSANLLDIKNQLTDAALTGSAIQFAETVGRLASGPLNELTAQLSDARKSLAATAGDFSLVTEEIQAYYIDAITTLSRSPDITITKQVLDLAAASSVARIKLEEARPTIEFYANSFNEISSATKDAEQSISELLRPISYYDAALQQLQKRGGIGINDENNRRLLDAVKNLDNLNAKLKVLNALNDVAAGFTDSFIQLNKELLKGGNLLKSVEQFAKDVADRTLDVVLEFTLRPIQEKMFKDMAARLGIEGPQDPLLKPINNIDRNIAALLKEYQKPFNTGAAQSPAQNNIVPGPTATQSMGGGRPAVTPESQWPRVGERVGGAVRPQIQGGIDVKKALGLSDQEIAAAVNTAIGEYGGPDPLGRTDVFANILSRSRSGMFPRNIVDIVAQPGQYAPNFGLSRDQITSPTRYGQATFNKVKAELLNSSLLQQSINDVNGRLYFKGVSQYGNMMNGDFLRARGQNFFHGPGREPGTNDAITKSLLAEISANQQLQPVQVTEEMQKAITDRALAEFDNAIARTSERLNTLSGSATAATDAITTASQSVANTGDKLSEAAAKFQTTVGTGLQLLTGIAMGIGGAQMIRRGGAYNTLMGAASIFGSISSVTGMFGSGGSLSGLFGGKTPTAVSGISGAAINGIKKIGTNFNLKGYASGGRPDPYEPVWVGENGPEVWMADRPGTIIPTEDIYVPGLDDTGSDAPPIGRYARRAASGSTSDNMVSSDTEYTGNFGRAVPYQRTDTSREIDRLERVATSPKELPPIKYETTRVNDYEFVTPDQLEASNARTAKMARNQTLREIADSVKLRKSLGI